MGKIRVGSGYDVHKFADKAEGSHMFLCGVKIPCDFPIIAHSDGDVALHALTDAILGSISAQDIGYHFPPSNKDFKGMNSKEFLIFALKKLQERGGRINNIDITIICETPKISPYRSDFIESIADMLSIDKEDVSVKATTTEKLGFTGRKEGIACQATVCVELN